MLQELAAISVVFYLINTGITEQGTRSLAARRVVGASIPTSLMAEDPGQWRAILGHGPRPLYTRTATTQPVLMRACRTEVDMHTNPK